jgi:hypothetical protein
MPCRPSLALQYLPIVLYRGRAHDAVDLLDVAVVPTCAYHHPTVTKGVVPRLPQAEVLVACWERVDMIGAIRSLSLSLSISTCIMWWDTLEA